jgi:Tol biopolymer transport system component
MTELQAQCIYEFGDYRVEENERLLKRNGEVIHLPPKAIDLLLVLLESDGRVLTKDELMRRVWADSFVEETNLTHNISLLRRVLGEKKNGEKFIETIPRRGYRFVTPVIQLLNESVEIITRERTITSVVTEEELEISDAPPTNEKILHAPPKSFKPKRAAAISILALAVILGIGSYVWLKREKKNSALPFQQISVRQLTTNGNVVNAALSPDGRYFVYALAESAGQSLWVQQVNASRAVQIAPPAKVNYWGLAISPEGDYVYCSIFEANKADVQLKRVPMLGGLIETIPLGKSVDSTITFSPDGARFAWTENCGDRSELRVADRDGSNNRLLAERRKPSLFSYESASSSWSPDGAVIAAASRDVDQSGEFMSVVGVDAMTGTEKFLTAQRWAAVNHLAWLRDGSGLIVIAKKAFGSPAQIWLLAYPSGAALQLTNDLNSYEWLGVTNDFASVLTVQQNSVTRLLVAGENQPIETAPTVAQQTGSHDQIGWTNAGQIAYFSFAGDETNLWLMNADGSNPRQLTSGMHAFKGLAVSPDGSFIVFSAARAGKPNIWRVDADGQNLKQLTNGDGEAFPTISPDGKWIVYQQGITSRVSLQKIPATGGAESVPVTEWRGIRPQFSPDGKSVAFFFMDKSAEEEPQWCIGVVSVENGQMQKKLPLAPTIIERFLRWTPDGKSIAYISSEGDTSNIILHPLGEKSPPRPLTNFQNGAGMIQAFAWSPGGGQFAVTRESNIRDVILIGNAR